MEFYWPSFLYLLTFSSCLAFLFLGAVNAQKGKRFWAVRLLFTSVNLMIGGTYLVGLALLATNKGFVGDLEELTMALNFIFFLAIFVGLVLYPIGFYGLCFRWRLIGKRRAVLLQITTDLAATGEQVSQGSQALPTHNTPSEP